MEEPQDEGREETDPWAPARNLFAGEVERVLRAAGAPVDPSALRRDLETPSDGPADFAVPLHRAARAVQKPAPELAQELAAAIQLPSGLGKVSADGAYLNFHHAPQALAERTLSLLFARGPRYGQGLPTGRASCVEHTSANPNGPFHVGRIRNAVIGDTLARILRAAGETVTTQYYVDDIGRQVAILTWIWSKPMETWPAPLRESLPPSGSAIPPGEKEDRWFGRPYPTASEFLKKDESAAEEVATLGRDLESGRAPASHRPMVERVLNGMIATLGRLGIHYDEFVWESSFLADGSVEKVIGRLREAPHAVQESNGAWAIDAAGMGLPKESAKIVFLRADGTSLYVTRDIAYHLAKFARFPRVIDVLGADHLLHARTLSALLGEIGEARRPEFLFYQYILAAGGAKMSTREGTAVYVDDLLEEAHRRAKSEVLSRREDLGEGEIDQIAEAVGTSAIRYLLVRVAADKPVQFRWEEALSFEGRSAPFLQYSYARATTLLRKAGRETPPYPYSISRLGTPEELALLRVLSRLPGTIQYAARSAHVHTLATFAHELADAFHRFYQEVPVLRAETEREDRIALVAATRMVLGTCLDLLGLARLERM